jgi:uncharacterized membrane protein
VPGWLLPGLQQLGNPHPLIVHFPIALLYAAALLYFLAWAAKRESLEWTALWVLGLGALGAGAAWVTGRSAGEGVMLAQSVKDALLENHERLMTATAIIAAVMTLWALVARPMPARFRWLFLVGLVAMIGVLTAGADYGGRMVYDYNAGGNACGQPIEFTK